MNLEELLDAISDGRMVNLVIVQCGEFSPAETEQIVQDRLATQLHDYLQPSLN